MNITERFNSMKRDKLDVAHFQSADVISNEKDNYIVLHSNGTSIDVIFYESPDDYVNHTGIVLCQRESYSESLQLAQLILTYIIEGDNRNEYTKPAT